MKKILIFGLPRTGTTVLQKHLGRSLNIKGYNEPFNDSEYRKNIGDPYQWVEKLDRGIIKVLAADLDYVNLKDLISAGKFDSIIITHRRSLTDLCISLYYAEQVTQQYHYIEPPTSIIPFIFPLEFIDTVMVSYRWYKETLNNLNKNSIPYTVFDYDKYQEGALQIINGVTVCSTTESTYTIGTVSANIPYSTVCLNYKEVKTIIDKIQSIE